MKRHRIAWAMFIAVACMIPVFAQSTAAGADPLSRLLIEVHALRVAIERSASAAPQIQLLSARLSVQNERLARAAREADAVHTELGNIQRAITELTAEGSEIEDALTHATDPTKQQELRQQGKVLKDRLDGRIASEGPLRIRDSEFANALATEQTQWAELNRRLDELERQLAVRPPQ